METNLFIFRLMNYWILTGGWVLYFVLHSAMAAEKVKHLASRKGGRAYRYYRLFYSIFSTAGLVGLLILNGSIEADLFFKREGIIRYLSLFFTTFGVMTIQLAFRNYNLKSFLGFGEEKVELRIVGISKYVRHPIYAGLILITTGFFLFIPNAPTLVTCLCIFSYLPIGIYLEEKKLIAIFGEKYIEYRKKVPSIFPRLPVHNQGLYF